MSSIPLTETIAARPESDSSPPLTSADQNAWRLVNHGLAWTMLGVLILALAGMGVLLAILLGQALLASLAAAWNDQRTIARIKWYLKCQFALPLLLLVTGIGCGLLLPPGIAMILITTAVNISYVYLAVQLVRNINLLHRGILWQLEPERAKVAAAPPPKPVIDPLAD